MTNAKNGLGIIDNLYGVTFKFIIDRNEKNSKIEYLTNDFWSFLYLRICHLVHSVSSREYSFFSWDIFFLFVRFSWMKWITFFLRSLFFSLSLVLLKSKHAHNYPVLSRARERPNNNFDHTPRRHHHLFFLLRSHFITLISHYCTRLLFSLTEW